MGKKRKQQREGDENQKPPKKPRYDKGSIEDESSEEESVVPSGGKTRCVPGRVLAGVQRGRLSVGPLSVKARMLLSRRKFARQMKWQLAKMAEERVGEAATTESKKELQEKRKNLPRITGHPQSETFYLGLHYTYLRCTTSVDGWKKHFKWLRFDDEVQSTSYETLDYQNESHLKINFPDANAPDAKSLANSLGGRYQCEVTFEETYCDDEKEDHPVVLWSRSQPAKIVEETKLLSSDGSVSWPSCSAVAKHPVSAKKFCDIFTKCSITAAAFCHAFMETRKHASGWRKMRKYADALISADWLSEAEYTRHLEVKVMQPLVRSMLKKAVGMDIADDYHGDFGGNLPDGVIYRHSCPIGIIETKLKAGAGDEEVQLLDYQESFAVNTLKKDRSLYPESGQAFPCFLISVRGQFIHLYGAIRLLESTSPQSWRIHYSLLAAAMLIPGRRDECAKFLSKLKKGLKLLEQFWSDGGKSMRFDEKGYPLPCDCVAEQLHESKEFRFTSHLSRNVFTGQLGEDICIAKLAESGYGVEAHRSCAGEGVAPSLISSKQFHFDGGQFCGVLMEKLKGEFIPLDQAFLTWELMKAAVASEIKEGIKKALKTLHDNSLVHGDLRAPNVFVSEEGKVKVIDFDWSGLEDTKIYPDVNYRLLWPEGVGYKKPLKKAHDWCLFYCHCLVLDSMEAKQAN